MTGLKTSETRRIPRPTRRKKAPGPVDGRGLDRSAWLLMIPAFLPILIFSVVPLLQGMYLGFTNAEAGRNTVTSFTGIENYIDILGDRLFLSSFRIGIIWAVAVTLFQFLLGFGLALLLNLNLRGRTFARILALVPWAMPPVVVGLMWRLIYHPNAGFLNEGLRMLGLIDRDINWLGDFSLALPAVIVVGIWRGLPQTTVTLLAGLQGVPDSLKEAAALDGANGWQMLRRIHLPIMRPVIVAITSLDLIWNFNSFGLVFVLTGGGPGGQTRLPLLFAYEEAFRFGHFGRAAALGNVMVVVMIGVLFAYLRKQMRETA